LRLMTSVKLKGAPWNCSEWTTVEPSILPKDAAGLIPEKYSVILGSVSDTADGVLFHRAVDALLAYDVFPPQQMRALVCTSNNRVSMGATIVQRIFLGPIGFEVAVRVVDVFSGEAGSERRSGFTYATLQGHMEKGISSFIVEQKPGGPVSFSIETRSRPGHWLIRFSGPLARLIQKRANKKALAHLQAVVR